METKVMRVTPDQAKIYLKNNNGNRPLRQATVDFYAGQMKRGQWKLNGEAVIISKSGRLLDGQHRLQAVVRCDTAVDMLIVSGVDDSAFTTIDQGRSRTIAQVLAIANIPQHGVITLAVQKKLTKNRWNSQGKVGNKINSQDVLQEYNQHPDFYLDAARFAGRKVAVFNIISAGELAGIIAHLVLNLNHPKQFVFDFFDKAYALENKGSVGCKLVEALVRGQLNNKGRLNLEYKRNLISKAWNIHVKQQSFDLKTPQILKWVKGVEPDYIEMI